MAPSKLVKGGEVIIAVRFFIFCFSVESDLASRGSFVYSFFLTSLSFDFFIFLSSFSVSFLFFCIVMLLAFFDFLLFSFSLSPMFFPLFRSEERRVGKECC